MKSFANRSPERCNRPEWRSLSVLAVVLLVACGRQDSDSHPVLTYNCAANTREITALREELPRFRETSGIEIRLNPFSGEEKLYAMMAARQAPDIFYTNNAVRDRLAAEGRLLDLDPFARADPTIARFPAEVLTATRSIDGGLYSIQNYTHTCGVYYNRELFARAGIKPPNSEWTWEDMRTVAARLTEDSNGDGRTDRYGIFIPAHFVEAFEQMNHAPIHRNTIFLDISPEATEVHERFLALIRDGFMPDVRRVQALGMQAAQLLQSGRVAMLVEGVPHPGLMETLTIDWGLAPLPRFHGRTPRYFRSDSGGISISAATESPDAAWTALVWLISEASAYQPNPMVGTGDFVDAWISKHPGTARTGFREVWNLSEQFPGGDPRYFVRFSSWSSHAILTRLQPLLDQLWAGAIQPDAVVEAVPGINREVEAELRRQLRSSSLLPGFREALEEASIQIGHPASSPAQP